MFIGLLSIISVAEAGCALDTERAARWAAAPLIVEGVITDIVIRDGAVMEYLQVHTVHKGLLATDGLWLRTRHPYAGCASPIVFAPGTEMYAIGAPDPDQSLSISPCNADIGMSGQLSEDLAAVAAAQPETAGQFLGADWQRMFAPLPDITGADGRRAVLLRDGVEYQGAFLSAEHGVVNLLVDAGDLELLFRAREQELLPVVSATWPVADGGALHWRAGAVVGSSGYPELPDGMAGGSPLPTAAIGMYWTPEPHKPPGALEEVLLAPGRVTLRAEPGGAPLLSWELALRTAASQVAQVPGWRQLWIDAGPLVGTAWVSEDAVEDDAMSGGVVGGLSGGFRSDAPLRIRVPAGVSLRRADGAVLGRTRKATSVKYLVDDGERAWVTIAWPAGELVATVPCRPASGGGPCEVAAP